MTDDIAYYELLNSYEELKDKYEKLCGSESGLNDLLNAKSAAFDWIEKVINDEGFVLDGINQINGEVYESLLAAHAKAIGT